MDLPVPAIAYAGPMLLGGVFCFLLFGVLLVQVVQYAQTVSSSEKLALKCLVFFIFAAQLINLVVIAHNSWRVLVLGFLNPMNFVTPTKSFTGISVINGIVSFAVQGFFSWAIFTMASAGPLRIVSAAVLLLAVVQLAGSLATGIKFGVINRDLLQRDKLKPYITVHLAASVACDLLITTSMVFLFIRQKGNTLFGHTHTWLTTVLHNTVENGFIATAAAIANIAVYFLRTSSASDIAFQYVIGGLYAIVLVTALNRRQSSRGRADGPTSISLSDADNFGSHPRANGAAPASVRTPPQFQVNVMRNNDQHDAGSDSDYGDAGSPVPRKAARFDQDIMVSVRTEVHKDGSIRYGEKENSFVAI